MTKGTPLRLLPMPTAAQVCKLSPEPWEPPPGEKERPHDFLLRITEAGLYPLANQFLAFGLPKPVAVLWVLRCISTAVKEISAGEKEALTVAERWGKAPTEANRQPTFASAQKAGFGTPGGAVALAVFWSGGSLAPPGLPPVPPAEGLTGQTLTGALALAAVAGEPDEAEQFQRRFFELAIQIDSGALTL